MPVYNYVWGKTVDGETPADDAPPFIVTAVERWLADQTLEGSAAITVAEISEPRLSLLVLHGEDDDGATDYVHAIVVPDRQLAAETPPRRLRQLFESLYGGRLDRALAALRAELAGLPLAALAPRVLRHFATDADVESLRWLRMGSRRIVSRAPQAASPSSRDRSRWRLPIAVGAGALALLVGVVAGAWLANPEGPGSTRGRRGRAAAEGRRPGSAGRRSFSRVRAGG